jgi:hypothetical protein
MSVPALAVVQLTVAFCTCSLPGGMVSVSALVPAQVTLKQPAPMPPLNTYTALISVLSTHSEPGAYICPYAAAPAPLAATPHTELEYAVTAGQ